MSRQIWPKPAEAGDSDTLGSRVDKTVLPPAKAGLLIHWVLIPGLRSLRSLTLGYTLPPAPQARAISIRGVRT
jgi:hypothetical protein